MSTDPQERFIELTTLWAACKKDTEELEARIQEALASVDNGAGHKPTEGILLLLKSFRGRQERLWAEMQKLLEPGGNS